MHLQNKIEKRDANTASFSFSTSSQDVEQENRLLKDVVSQLRSEVDRYRTPALMVAEVCDVFGEKALIRIPNGNKFLVNRASTVGDLLPGETVAVEQKNLTIVEKLESSKQFDVQKFVIVEKPEVGWDAVGGLQQQIREVKEVIELPLMNPGLFKRVGITPPKGILLHGPPGTGKTLLAKAIANATNATFIEIVASELVQKFIGEGAKLIKEIFALAKEKAPTILFIDEIDALAATRVDLGTSGEREVQRTFMQLLAEIDGFKPLDHVKIIASTNRKDILDPAILRPGRFDRIIEIPHPTPEGVKQIFDIHTKPLVLRNVDKGKVTKNLEGLTGAEIHSVVTEAGYFAIRNKRTHVREQDFLEAINKLQFRDPEPNGALRMFG